MVSETWLSAEVLDCEIHILGYNLICKDRYRHGGGVAIYIRDVIAFKSLVFPHPELELVLLECHFGPQLSFQSVISVLIAPPPPKCWH